MHEAGGGYRRLGRNSIVGVPVTRNIASFVSFISLAVFVVLFYLYISARSDFQTLRDEFSNQGEYVAKLKNELLELNTKMEKAQNVENECKAAKSDLNTKYQECTGELGRQKDAVEGLEGSARDKDSTISNLRTQLDESQKLVESLRSNISSMQVNPQTTQDEVIKHLKADLSQKDALIAELKLAANSKDGNKTLTQQSGNNIPSAISDAGGSQAKAVGVAPPLLILQPRNGTTTTPAAAAPFDGARLEQESNVLGEGDAPAADDSVKAGEVNSLEVNGGEPKAGGEPPVAANNQNEAEGLSNEIRSGQGEFLAERQPGGRVKLEEKIRAKENNPDGSKVAGDSPLLKAAAAGEDVDNQAPAGGDSAVNAPQDQDDNNADNNDADENDPKLK